MNELLLINKYIKPLVSNNIEAMSLADDVALITKSAKNNIQVITTDCMIEDIHFFMDEDPKSIAYRLIICNLSDLSSKGITPKFFTLTFCPKKISELKECWVKSFFNTIDELQNQYNIKLIGGNVASTNSKLMLSVTFIGESNKCKDDLPFRFKAKIEDEIYVSGFIGEAYLGYCIIASEKRLIKEPDWLRYLNCKEKKNLINKYYYPQISLELGYDLLQYANACTDASDGIINSAYNICNSSNTNAKIKLSTDMFSSITQKIISFSKNHINFLPNLINWGGDYNLVFTIPNEKKLSFKQKLITKYIKQNMNISYLGKIIKRNSMLQEELKILDINNNVLNINIIENLHK